MRGHLLISIMSTVMSMGMMLIIMGQNQALITLNSGSEMLQKELEKLDHQLTNKDAFKVKVDNLLAKGTQVVVDLEATLAKLVQEIEQKKTENDACLEEKETIDNELTSTDKKHTKTEDSLQAESDTWKQEIKTLKAQLMGYSPICDYVKKKTVKLCANANNNNHFW